MKKFSISKLFLIVVLFLSLFFRQPQPAKADSCVNAVNAEFVGPTPPTQISAGTVTSVPITIRGSSFPNGDVYKLLFRNTFGGGPVEIGSSTVSNGTLSFNVTHSAVLNEHGQKTLQLQYPSGGTCELWQWDVSAELTCQGVSFSQAGVNNSYCLDTVSGPIHVTVTGLQKAGTPFSGEILINTATQGSPGTATANNGTATGQLSFIPQGNVTFEIRESAYPRTTPIACTSRPVNIITTQCTDEARTTPPPTDREAASFELCKQILNEDLQAQCRACATSGTGGDAEQGGVWTAVGCISRDPVDIAERMIQVGLGMGGGVALLMTLAGGFILSTSQGDPQKANQAKEMITNSVIGLLFVIFSVVILQFIGVTILRIPGFGADTEQVN